MKSSQPFRLFLIFSVLSALLILSMFYRVSNAVIAPNLIQDLRLNAFPRVNQAYPAQAYHLAFLICFLGMAASVIFYAFSKREKTSG